MRCPRSMGIGANWGHEGQAGDMETGKGAKVFS